MKRKPSIYAEYTAYTILYYLTNNITNVPLKLQTNNTNVPLKLQTNNTNVPLKLQTIAKNYFDNLFILHLSSLTCKTNLIY